MSRGNGKTKAWRAQAAAVKARFAIEHPTYDLEGKRFGRVIKKSMVRILPSPSFLFQAMCIRVGIIKGDQA